MQKMSFEERLAIDMESLDLLEAGKKEEAMALHRKKAPMYPWLAKIIKEKVGADFLRKYEYNLTEAEVEFGPGWLDN
jgi:hypothetical protein